MKNFFRTYPDVGKWTRITFLHLSLVLCLSSVSYAGGNYSRDLLSANISLRLDNVTLREALQVFEQRTGLSFSYSQDFVLLDQKVSVNAKNDRLSRVLEKMLKPLQIQYELMDNQVLLKKVRAPKPESRASVVQPALENAAEVNDITVTGTITSSDNNQTMPGVNVVIKGTTNGTITDAQGRYSITVPSANDVLVFSFVGYNSEEVTVGNRSVIDIKLVLDIKSLGEVVVVGYGTQKRRDLTGAIVGVSAKEISQVPIISADQALQGRVAGVQVQQTSGAPGGAIQVRVRGVNSTGGNGGNQPLYVIDGIPLAWSEQNNSIGNGNIGAATSNGSSALAGISPNDIESMEILKDASATAIYGARAANGVVLITTKRGKLGRTQINFNAYYGVQSLRKKIPMINARERMSLIYEWRRNAGDRGGETIDIWAINPYLYNYNGTDWQDELFREAPMQNYNLSVSGGTDKITFATSVDYMDQQGTIVNTFAKRYSVRANLDVKASDRLKFGTSTALSYSMDNRISTDNYNNLERIPQPLSPVRDAQGNFTGRPNTIINGALVHDGGSNLVASVTEDERRSDRYRILSNVYGELEIAKGLSFKSLIGVDYLFNELRTRTALWVRGVDANTTQVLGVSQPRTFNWVADQSLFYRRSFGIHSLDAVLGFSAQEFQDNTFAVTTNGSSSNALEQLNNMPNYQGGPSGVKTVNALVSQFVRVNYGLLDRYLLTATVRRDGSSRFGPNFKYGYFPAFSLGWRISEEPFIKNLVTIPELKLRVSYGSTGNQNINNFLYLPLMSGADVVWGNTRGSGSAPTRFENRDIQWERTNQFDAGIDLALFNNRLTITADYYDKRTNGLLGDVPLSYVSGVGNKYMTNLGSVSNRGLEFAVNGVIIDNKAVRWSANFNIATNKNNVESLGNPLGLNGDVVDRPGTFINRTEAGHPIGGFWVLQEEGQYQTWAEAAEAPKMAIGTSQPYFAPGDFKPVDQNGDKVIDDKDRVWYGSPFPDFFGGFGSSVSYKRFTLDVVGAFQHGNLLWNQPRLNSESFERSTWRTTYENRWLPSQPGTVTSVPVPRNNNPMLTSNRFLEDASFVRLRTITLAYEFKPNLISKLKLSRARVYLQANNFVTFTKYSGWDPEVNSYGSSVQTNGIDIAAYPIPKSLMVGINLGL